MKKLLLLLILAPCIANADGISLFNKHNMPFCNGKTYGEFVSKYNNVVELNEVEKVGKAFVVYLKFTRMQNTFAKFYVYSDRSTMMLLRIGGVNKREKDHFGFYDVICSQMQ